MLISNENLIVLAKEHLDNNPTYQLQDCDKTASVITEINTSLDQLYQNKNISKCLYKKLYLKETDESKPGNFRILPKIHKKEFGIRPIISCVNHPTRKLCILIDAMLNPIIESIKHILKDSQNLLQYLLNFQHVGKMFLYSCDFESLYTNIKPEHAVDVISIFLYTKTSVLQQFQMDIHSFRIILKLIFKCNIFKFNLSYYIQLILQLII